MIDFNRVVHYLSFDVKVFVRESVVSLSIVGSFVLCRSLKQLQTENAGQISLEVLNDGRVEIFKIRDCHDVC